MITQNIHVRMDAYGIPPIIHAVEGDTWRYLDIYTDDAAINTSNTAAVAIHRPDNSYYTISATPDVGGFYHLEMDQALTRPGKVECQLKVSSGDLVISTYTFYVIVEPSTTGLPTEQLGYDIYDLIDAAQQIQNVGLTDDIKQALLDCFEHVAWTDEHGQDYVDALEAALYPPAELVSISAVYTQSGTVYTTDSLDDLKSDLVVTAYYTDSTTETVTTYTLSGTLTEGTSVITVSYGGKTTTFNVTVTEYVQTYVTNGLIHQWDAIDNTGNGHDGSVTTWADLVGTDTLTMHDSTKASWESNAIAFTGVQAQYLVGTDAIESPGGKTIEICMSPLENHTGVVGVILSQTSPYNGKVVVYSDNTFGVQGESAKTYTHSGANLTSLHYVAASYTNDTTTNKAYADGNVASKGNATHSLSGKETVRYIGAANAGGSNYPFKGKIHAIRVYDRILTDEEIANNYAVDVSRFSLVV